MNSKAAYIGLIGIWLLLIVFVAPVAAVTRVVEEVEVLSVAEGVEIQINFNFPLRYMTHSPVRAGQLLQVELRSLFAVPEMVELSGRTVYSWKPSAGRPLRSLTYDGDAPGGPQWLLEFDHEVEYRIKGESDPLRLTILLKPQLHLQPKPVKAQPVVVAPAPAPVAPLEKIEPAAPMVMASPAVVLALPYVINLESALKPLDKQLPAEREDLRQYRLYTTRFKKGGHNWHRLRLGFFSDKKSAQRVMLTLKKEFPEAWLSRTTLEERRDSVNTALFEPAPLVVEAPAASVEEVPVALRPAEEPLPVLPAERRQQLLDQAEANMVAGDYQRAALLYTSLLQAEDAATRQLAQEYLGLARDRANQLAHAKAEYEKYLQLYPEGEASERVRQRLSALLTARSTPKDPLRKAKQQSADAWKHDAYGSLSQFYFHDSLITDEETRLAQSSLRTDVDINTRSRGENLDVRTTFIGGLENDFRDGGDDEVRVSSLYLDIAARQPELSLRLGRQSRSSGGVLGRFDGGLLRWQISERVSATLVSGFPVYSTRETSIDTERPLYGLSFDFGTFANRWDINLYIINQAVDSMTDRRAVGGEVRYFEPTRSFFSLVDYDIFYNKLNTALFNGNLRFPDNTTLTLSADYRNSPVLTTSNALQGQTVDSISALRRLFSDDEINQLALDRTANSQSYTLGLTHPLSEKLQVSGDVSVARFGSTVASGGVEALDGGGNSYYYSLQLIGSSLIKQGDIAIVGLRYSDTDSSASWALNLNTRYPLLRELRLNPKILVDYRDNKNGSGNRWRIRPALRVEYRWKKRLHLEFEGGAEWADETNAGQTFRSRDFFLTLGYRVDF